MVFSSPAELNSIGDDALLAHVTRVLLCLNDPSARKIPPVATFITADVLLRLHNLTVARCRETNHNNGWSKHSTLARVVGSFTGVFIRQCDGDFIGNAQDYFLRDYVKKTAKARNTESQKAGKEVSNNVGARLNALKEEVYKCKFGGVPRNVIVASNATPIHVQPVPVRRIQHVDEINLQLQQEVIKLKQDSEQERDMRHNLNALCAAVEREYQARQLAEKKAAYATEAAEVQVAELAVQAAKHVQSLKGKLQDACRECNRARGQVERLGSQLGVAHVEVARAMEREEKLQREAAIEVERAAALQETLEHQFKLRIEGVKQRAREAESECKRAKGQVEIIGHHLSLAHVEVARAHVSVRRKCEKTQSKQQLMPLVPK